MSHAASRLGVLGLVLALSACADDAAKNDNPARKADPAAPSSARLTRFDSCDALRTRVADAWTEQAVGWWYGGYYRGYPEAEAGADSSDSAGGGSGPSDYSETNVQVEGVDEPDLVKTDGNYLYVVDQITGALDIVKSWPAADTAVVAQLELDGYPSSMFLDGDTLVVFSYVYDAYTGGSPDTEWDYGYAQRISLIDVSDRTAPVVTREIDVEGYMAAGRKIDSNIYVVLDGWMNTPEALWNLVADESLGLPTMDWEADEATQEALREEARAILAPAVATIVAGMSEDDLLPTVWDHAPGEYGVAQRLMDCTDLYAPDALAQLGTLSILHLDLAETTPTLSATGILASGWQVYASQQNLYVAQTSWSWWWGWGDTTVNSQIHKFSLAGAETAYEASGAVDGWLLSQFSMDEREGKLRVATTDFSGWGGGAMEGDVATSDGGTSSGSAESGGSTGSEPAPRPATPKDEPTDPANNVFVLEQADADLNVIGALRGIAPTEQLYAVRFLGETGYVVTFRQTDPLFVVDLSDPTAPSIAGELHVPGYSSYLHPIAGGYLLAVGMDGTEDGTVTGFAVSLFDVRDPANPTRVDQLTIESDDWSWSEALWDHHAFTYYNGVLSVPIYTYDYDDATGAWDGFSGLLVVDVDTSAGLSEIGRVDHADMVADSECPWYGEGYGRSCPDDYWYAGMRRSVVIEDDLYSISDYGVKVTAQRDPADEIAQALFRPL